MYTLWEQDEENNSKQLTATYSSNLPSVYLFTGTEFEISNYIITSMLNAAVFINNQDIEIIQYVFTVEWIVKLCSVYTYTAPTY